MTINSKQAIIGITTSAVLLALSSSGVVAAERCETQYGGGQLCVRTGELQVNKKVYDPTNNEWKDNLYVTDYRFSPNSKEEISYKLIIKNVGQETLHDVKIEDRIPSFLFVTDKGGAEEKDGKLTWTVKDINPNESVEKYLKARPVASSLLKKEATVICDDRTTNVVEVWASDSTHDKDTAQVCINNTLGLKSLPATGPSSLLPLFGALIAGLTGLVALRAKKA